MPIFILLLTFFVLPLRAESPVKVGGFLDTYYAYDSNQPSNHEREFTTQPVRHNEFSINLAYIEAILNQETTRGRLALQYGDSVKKNTSLELNQDATIFQEAYLGKKLGEKTWVDVGIFLGNIGAESWISKDNWTYTRAMNLDYVPYYSAGVRLEHSLNEKQSFQIQIINGWQVMGENNQGKAVGMQYKHLLTPSLTFTYNNFAGDEEVVPNLNDNKFRSRFRAYHNFILKWLKSDTWNYLASFDVGHQAQQENNGVDGWYATSVTFRRILNTEQSLALRLEYFGDPHQTTTVTRTPNGFQVSGASLNFDQSLDHNIQWRNELRGFFSKDEIYPEGAGHKNRWDAFFVTSLSAWI